MNENVNTNLLFNKKQKSVVLFPEIKCEKYQNNNKIKSAGPFSCEPTLIFCLLICFLFWRRYLCRNRLTGGNVGMFGPFSSVDCFASVLPFLSLQPASFDKMVYPGLQALAARTLQQGPVVSLPAAFY